MPSPVSFHSYLCFLLPITSFPLLSLPRNPIFLDSRSAFFCQHAPFLLLCIALPFLTMAFPRPSTKKRRSPETIDFFIWTSDDVGTWLEDIGLGGYKEAFTQNHITGEYLDNLSNFTTEEILRFIRRCHMKWGDFINLCKELRRVKVACFQGAQEVRRPWWAPACLNNMFVRAAKRCRQSRVVSVSFDP